MDFEKLEAIDSEEADDANMMLPDYQQNELDFDEIQGDCSSSAALAEPEPQIPDSMNLLRLVQQDNIRLMTMNTISEVARSLEFTQTGTIYGSFFNKFNQNDAYIAEIMAKNEEK